MNTMNILVLDDEQGYRDELNEFFQDFDFTTHLASRPSEALQIMTKSPIDIAILDVQLPEMSGLEVLEKIQSTHKETEVIMITGHGDMDTVIDAMRRGAADFIPKPFRLTDVQQAIERTKRYKVLKNKLREVEKNYSLVSQELQKRVGTEIIGTSPQIKAVINLMSKVAKSGATSVLITGESGTGKELVARGIHCLSDRKKNYFHSVNCSAVPESLFESEFFGHSKGSFTGAVETKSGWFEISNNGTLFLDEIGEMQLNLQAKFLRALDDKVINRIGSHKEILVDVRIITATNQDLKEMVEAGKFRRDLFHRLNSFNIHLPPLRERKEDIPVLLKHFVKQFAEKQNKTIRQIDPKVEKELCFYAFPGNVRELRNMAERAVILCDTEILTLAHFEFSHSANQLLHMDTSSNNEIYDLELLEKITITKVMKKLNNNKSKAAEMLNISRQALDRRIQKYNL